MNWAVATMSRGDWRMRIWSPGHSATSAAAPVRVGKTWELLAEAVTPFHGK